jgi:hypothetical protein
MINRKPIKNALKRIVIFYPNAKAVFLHLQQIHKTITNEAYLSSSLPFAPVWVLCEKRSFIPSGPHACAL